MPPRDAKAVMDDHLRMRREGELDEDLRRNYHEDVVVLTASEVFRGHDGVRASMHKLWKVFGDEHEYVYDTVMVEDRFALLEWRGRTEELNVTCGVDSYIIEDGLIVAQSIHYRVEHLGYSVSGATLTGPGERGPTSKDDTTRMHELADG